MYGDSDVIRSRVDRLREQADDIRASADILGRTLSISRNCDREKKGPASTVMYRS